MSCKSNAEGIQEIREPQFCKLPCWSGVTTGIHLWKIKRDTLTLRIWYSSPSSPLLCSHDIVQPLNLELYHFRKKIPIIKKFKA